MAVVFTVAVIVNFVALGLEELPFWIYLLPLLSLFTGWYMFVLPYAIKWSRARRVEL